MKRLIITVDGQVASPAALKAADREASRQYSAHWRVQKVQEKRQHRKLTEEEREAKRQRTAQRKREREAQRDAKEHERLMRRLKFVTLREEREIERALRIKASYKSGWEPRFNVVCPKSLYRRVHSQLPSLPSQPARTAADGCRNIVLKFSCRGFGKKAPGTRSYKAGEAGRAARYIARPEGIEDVEGAVLTNVLGQGVVADRCFTIDQQQEVVGFFDALEQIERATGESHVYTHLIMAMPYELGPVGRAQALRQYCTWLSRLNVPFSAALHKPDAEGSQRNFHAHIVLGTRPFSYGDSYSWAFEAGKLTELISGAGRRWLRTKLAEALNKELKVISSPIRYDGRSQADRGVPALADTHKGQKEVAIERKAAADEAVARSIIMGAGAHALRLEAELTELMDKMRHSRRAMSDGRERDASQEHKFAKVERDSERVNESAAVTSVEQQRRLHQQEVQGLRHAEGESDVAPARRRKEVIENSLLDYGRYDVTTSMEQISLALNEHPQAIALAVYEGRLQVAYVEKQLTAALSKIVNSPRDLAWLTRLADQLSFDHRSVPATWFEVSMHPDKMVLPFRATSWAAQHGGVQSPEGSGVAAPLRGMEM